MYTRLLVVTDKTTGLHLLMDTRAEIIVLFLYQTDRRDSADGSTLRAANSSPIATYDRHSLTLDIALCRALRWVSFTTEVSYRFIVSDFSHFDMDVCIRRHPLVHNTTQLNITRKASAVTPLGIHALALVSRFEQVLSGYPCRAVHFGNISEACVTSSQPDSEKFISSCRRTSSCGSTRI